MKANHSIWYKLLMSLVTLEYLPLWLAIPVNACDCFISCAVVVVYRHKHCPSRVRWGWEESNEYYKVSINNTLRRTKIKWWAPNIDNLTRDVAIELDPWSQFARAENDGGQNSFIFIWDKFEGPDGEYLPLHGDFEFSIHGFF